MMFLDTWPAFAFSPVIIRETFSLTTIRLAGILGFFGCLLLLEHLWSKRKLPLPPGPRGYPFIGCVSGSPPPGVLECHHWLQHRDPYGPISSIKIMGQTFIIVNDADMAMEMLRDRATSFSGRPKMTFSGEMIGWNNTLGMSGYNSVFRYHRKKLAKVASTSSSLALFDRVQEEESRFFLLNLLRAPGDLFAHIEQEAGAVILRITYGYTPKTDGRDPLIDMAVETMHAFARAFAPGKLNVDTFPILRYLPTWVPGTEFHHTASQMAAQLKQTTEKPYEFVRRQMRDGKHKTSFLSQAIEDEDADAEMTHLNKWTALSLYLGGADTTVSSLMTFFLVMTLYPEVQKRAQDEIDREIGPDRLPLSADKDRLPYIMALVKEVHRWHPVLPMGLPHACDQEATIRGYRIPKGSIVLPNNWWFTHDPSRYAEPSAFCPERFIEGPDHQAEPDPRLWTFGYGRRICPGRYVADNALFITISQVLAVYDVEKAVQNGTVVEPVIQFQAGPISHPLPYQTSIRPRSERHRALIERMARESPRGDDNAQDL